MSADARPRRVLFVSYLFPPVGGVGVLRVAKFVKYLPEFGWDSSVLTVSNPSVPLFDDSLLQEIPKSTIIRRAWTGEPGYSLKSSMGSNSSSGSRARVMSRLKSGLKAAANSLLQPDAQILWFPDAVRQGLRLLRSTPHDAIVASGPPFTNLLVGSALSRITKVPLVLDYRDEWDISNAYWENKRPGRVSGIVQRWQQNAAIRAASLITATTPSSARALQTLAEQAGSRATATHIYNGFDSADFDAPDRSTEREDFGNGTDRFRLSFAGTLWELTSIEPFVAGVRQLAAQVPALAEHLEIVIAGRRAGRQEECLDRLADLPCRTVRLGYLEHARAMRLMQTSDSLLLLLSDVPHANRVISSKVFEYMGARRPIFAVSPAGDQCNVLQGYAAATVCSPQRPDQIADALAIQLEAHRCGALMPAAVDCDVAQFERRSQAGQLARLLDELIDSRQSGHEEECIRSRMSRSREQLAIARHTTSPDAVPIAG